MGETSWTVFLLLLILFNCFGNSSIVYRKSKSPTTAPISSPPTIYPTSSPPTIDPTSSPPTIDPTSSPSVSPTSATPTVSNFCVDNDYDPLSCYLSNLVLDDIFPDSLCYNGSVAINQDDKDGEICLEDLRCVGIYIKSLPSKYTKPTTLQLGAEDLGTRCEGTLTFTEKKRIIGKQTVFVGHASVLINSTDFSLDLFVKPSEPFLTAAYTSYQVPVATAFTECDVTNLNAQIDFYTTLWPIPIPIHITSKDRLERLILKGLKTALCESLANYVAVNVTNTLVNVLDPLLISIADNEPSPMPIYNASAIDWNGNDSLVSRAHSFVDKVITAVSGGLIHDTSPVLGCIKGSLPKLLPEIVLASLGSSPFGSFGPLGKDCIVIRLNRGSAASPHTYQSHKDDHVTTLSLDKLTVCGLNSINDLTLLDSIEGSNSSLVIDIALDYLSVEVDATLTIDPTTTTTTTTAEASTRGTRDFNGKPPRPTPTTQHTYEENLSFTLAVDQPRLSSELSVAVNGPLLDSLYIDQLLSTASTPSDTSDAASPQGCWLSTLMGVDLLSLSLHVDFSTVRLDQVSGMAGLLEGDLISLLDNILLLGGLGHYNGTNDGYGPMVTAVIDGLVQGPVKAQLNTHIQDVLTQAKSKNTCIAHSAADDSDAYTAWSNSSAIHLLDALVAGFGPSGVNTLMDCVTNGTGVLTASFVLPRAADTDADDNTLPATMNTLLDASFTAMQALSGIRAELTGNQSVTLTVQLTGLDSCYDLHLLQPHANSSEPYALWSNIGLGYCSPSCDLRKSESSGDRVGCSPVGLTLSSTRSGSPEAVTSFLSTPTGLTDKEMIVSLCNITLSLDLLMEVQRAALGDLHMSQVGVTGCLASAMPELSIETLLADLSSASIVMSPNPLAALSTNKDHTGTDKSLNPSSLAEADNLMVFMNGSSSQSLLQVMNKLLARVTATKNTEIANELAMSDEVCAAGGVAPSSDDIVPNPSETNSGSLDFPAWAWTWQAYLVAAGLTLGLVVAYYFYRRAYPRSKDGGRGDNYYSLSRDECHDENDGYEYKESTTQGGLETFYPYKEGVVQQKHAVHAGHAGEPNGRRRLLRSPVHLFGTSSPTIGCSLFCPYCSDALSARPSIPLIIRVATPLIIVGTVAMMIISNMAPDAVSVMLEITLYIGQDAPVVLSPGSVFDFGLANTVRDMWSARVYTLAILISFFSGAWPYIKLGSMLVCFVGPSHVLSIGARRNWLMALDALGKWSLIDFFVMVMMLSSFYLDLYVAGIVYVNITVLPRWGFFGYLLATIISLVMGHIVLGLHRMTIKSDMEEEEQTLLRRERAKQRERRKEQGKMKKIEGEREGEEGREDSPSAYFDSPARLGPTLPFTQSGSENAEVRSGECGDESIEEAGEDRGWSQGRVQRLMSSVVEEDEQPVMKTDVDVDVDWRTYQSPFQSLVTLPFFVDVTGWMANDSGHKRHLATTTLSNNVSEEATATASATIGHVPDTDTSGSAEDMNGGGGAGEGAGEQPGVAMDGAPVLGDDQSTVDKSGNDRVIATVTVTNLGILVLVVMFILAAAMLLLGVTANSMTFKFEGLVGLLLGDQAILDTSTMQVGKSIPHNSGIPKHFSVIWVQCCYFLFTVGMPFTVLLTLLVLWLIPLRLADQQRLFVASEVLNAWASIDVYCLSTVAALLEIEQFAQFIVGDSCDGINQILENKLDPYLDGNDVCFDVVALLTGDSWALFVATVFTLMLTYPSLYVLGAVVERREQEEKKASCRLCSVDSLRETLRREREGGGSSCSSASSNPSVFTVLFPHGTSRDVSETDRTSSRSPGMSGMSRQQSVAVEDSGGYTLTNDSTSPLAPPLLDELTVPLITDAHTEQASMHNLDGHTIGSDGCRVETRPPSISSSRNSGGGVDATPTDSHSDIKTQSASTTTNTNTRSHSDIDKMHDSRLSRVSHFSSRFGSTASQHSPIHWRVPKGWWQRSRFVSQLGVVRVCWNLGLITVMVE